MIVYTVGTAMILTYRFSFFCRIYLLIVISLLMFGCSNVRQKTSKEGSMEQERKPYNENKKLKKENLNFMFVTDPMHGNTYESKHEHKLKTRSLSHIMEEISKYIDI